MALTTPNNPFSGIPISEIADYLIANQRFLTPAYIAKLSREFAPQAKGSVFDANFDLASEIGEQIVLARKLRDAVQSSTAITASPREVKEAIAASNTQLSLLVKLQERVLNMDRLRKVEEATLTVLKSLDPATADKFTDELTKALKA